MQSKPSSLRRFFTALVTIPVIKHSEIGVHNYPPDIQAEYFKMHKCVETAPLSKRTLLFKSYSIVSFSVLLADGAIVAGTETFWEGALFAALLFAHLKIFCLPGTEHMDKAYAQKWFHVKGMLLPGSLFLVIISVVVGTLMVWVA